MEKLEIERIRQLAFEELRQAVKWAAHMSETDRTTLLHAAALLEQAAAREREVAGGVWTGYADIKTTAARLREIAEQEPPC